jgi:hypothetical protein
MQLRPDEAEQGSDAGARRLQAVNRSLLLLLGATLLSLDLTLLKMIEPSAR